MAQPDYPIDLRVDYPERSSRGWAALTIFLIKFLALLPHGICLIFLGIAQLVVAFVAQVVVALNGEYPPGMHRFVTGVLRWSTRVSAFLFSLTDRYPPFTLQPVDTYPVDVVAERPAQQSRVYAAFTAIVQVLAVVGGIWLFVWVVRHADTSGWFSTAGDGTSNTADRLLNLTRQPTTAGGLLLRQIAALPHYVVLVALGFVSVLIWFVVQWIILFTANYPRGMHTLVAGIMRWQTRVGGYALGLVDRYPPFTLDPSIAAPAGDARQTAGTWPATGQWPQVGQAPTTAPPQWYPDPTGRHALRYWDGTRWTPDVVDEGRTGYDPLE
jgi:Domain of unknown function (DUF4389)/Protein of unknown function (DUF2510)